MRGLRLLPAALADVVRTSPGLLVFGELFMLAAAGMATLLMFIAPVHDTTSEVIKDCIGAGGVCWVGWSALRLRRNVRLATARTVFYNSLKGRGEPLVSPVGILREPDRPWQLSSDPGEMPYTRSGAIIQYERSETLGEIVFESRHVRCGRAAVALGAPDGRWMASLPDGPGVRVPHYEVEPADILDQPGPGKLLPRAAVAYVAGYQNGEHYVYRYTRDGRYAGHTWHHSLAAARAQLVFEYGDAATSATNWHDVPRYERNPVRCALKLAAQ